MCNDLYCATQERFACQRQELEDPKSDMGLGPGSWLQRTPKKLVVDVLP